MQNIFSSVLKRLRTDNKLMQKDIAQILGVSVSQAQKYEYGKQEPNIDKLIVLANYFNISLDELVGRTTPSSGVGFHEQNLLKRYNKLNDLGKDEVNKRIDELTEMPKYIQPQTVKVACRGAGIQEIDLEIIKKLIQDAEKNKDKNIDDLF